MGIFRAPKTAVRAWVRLFWCVLIGITCALLLAAGIGHVITYSKLQHSHLTTAGHMTCNATTDLKTGLPTGEQDCNINYSVDGQSYQIVAASVPANSAYASNQVVYYSPANPADAQTSTDFQAGPGTWYELIVIFLLVVAVAVGYGAWAAVTLSRLRRSAL